MKPGDKVLIKNTHYIEYTWHWVIAKILKRDGSTSINDFFLQRLDRDHHNTSWFGRSDLILIKDKKHMTLIKLLFG